MDAIQICSESGDRRLKEILHANLINPREYELLLHLSIVSKSISANSSLAIAAKEDLQEICLRFFGAEGDHAYSCLIMFAENRKNVAWGIFARTFNNSITWEEKNPLEGYIPRRHSIRKIIASETIEFA